MLFVPKLDCAPQQVNAVGLRLEVQHGDDRGKADDIEVRGM
jgi:hypothetical protein